MSKIKSIPLDKVDNPILDSNIEQIMQLWSSFIQDKELVTIPLGNEIAYYLSQSKLLSLNNPFMTYMEQISNLIF